MNGKLKIAIVGTGSRGIGCFGELLKNRTNCETVALCDKNPVRLKLAAEKLNVNKTYSSIEDMLGAESLDGLIITTPDYLHEEHSVTALNAKVNVLLDKPLAIKVSGCRKIIDAAKSSGKVAMIGFNLRHHAVLRKLKSLIDSGTLGRLFLIENREFYDGGKTYMARWNRKYELCGGLWIHKGSHDFDVFNWLLGFPKPKKVSAFAGIDVLNPQNIPFELEKDIDPGPSCTECHYSGICPDCVKQNDPMWAKDAQKCDGYVKDLCIYTSDKNVHDNGIAIVEYENGVKASHLECFVSSQTDRLFTIAGTRGQATASLEKMQIKVYPRWSREVITYDIPQESGGHGGADPGLLDSFIKVLSKGSANTSTVEQGIWSTAIGEAAELARRENRVVFIDELFK